MACGDHSLFLPYLGESRELEQFVRNKDICICDVHVILLLLLWIHKCTEIQKSSGVREGEREGVDLAFWRSPDVTHLRWHSPILRAWAAAPMGCSAERDQKLAMQILHSFQIHLAWAVNHCSQFKHTWTKWWFFFSWCSYVLDACFITFWKKSQPANQFRVVFSFKRIECCLLRQFSSSASLFVSNFVVQLLSHVCRVPGFPVLNYLLEFAQTHVHWVSDATQPSHHLSSPSPAFSLNQHQGLFQWVGSSHQVAKVLEV